MPAITDVEAVTSMTPVCATCHAGCIACRAPSEGGLGLRFHAEEDGSVVAAFACHAQYCGHPGRLHGGIIATLLDAAMTHSLFARHIRGYTARLNIRYRHPVEVEKEARVRAWINRCHQQLFELSAEVTQDGRVCAAADAKFFGEPLEDDTDSRQT